jgi:drug/metabolite transporter (DMT)-like permease
VIWPLVASRTASLPLLVGVILLTKRSAASVTRGDLPMLSLIGLLDVGGSSFFALATSFGRLDIAAVLSSLYPAATALLAKTLLAEEINRLQWFGIAVALSAIILITL